MNITENPILIELLQGYELTMKLQAHLQQSCHVEHCKSLAKSQSTMGSFEKAISSLESLWWSVG